MSDFEYGLYTLCLNASHFLTRYLNDSGSGGLSVLVMLYAAWRDFFRWRRRERSVGWPVTWSAGVLCCVVFIYADSGNSYVAWMATIFFFVFVPCSFVACLASDALVWCHRWLSNVRVRPGILIVHRES